MECYYSFSKYLKEKFDTRIHRISLNAKFSCPNRDGKLSKEGCVFCNEKSFSHLSKTPLLLKDQIQQSIDLLKNRFKAKKFIAYFQNATNTYADYDTLKKAYDIIKSFPEIIGLSISTRPDCIDEKKLDLIESYSKEYEVWIEYGLQSVHDKTLKRINRKHTFSDSLKAIENTAKRNINIGAHIILGLPGESKANMIKTAKTIAHLPIKGIKLHALHVVSDTSLEKMFKESKIKLLEPDGYIKLSCDFLEELNPKCVIFRLVSDAKKDVLIAPHWINEKQKIIEGVKEEFRKRKTHQGSKYETKKSMYIR